MASLIIDIVIALICLVIIIRNAAQGFIKSFMAFARTVLAILLAYLFNAPLARLFDEKIFLSLSQKWIKDAFIATHDGNGGYQLYTIFEGIPEWFVKVLMRTGVDEATIQRYFYTTECAPIEVVDQLSQSIGALLSALISTIIAVVIIFVVIELLLLLVGHLLNKVKKISIVKFFDILLGALIGAAISAVLVLLIATAAIWVIRFAAGYNAEIFNDSIILNSIFLNFFHEHNFWKIIEGLVIGK